MKTIFIKSGNYTETPGITAAGAINSIHDFNVSHMANIKTDMAFRFDLINGEYRLYLSPRFTSGAEIYRTVDVDLMCRKADQFGFVYFGSVSDGRDVLGVPDILKSLKIVGLDAKTGAFFNCETGRPATGNTIVPVLFCVKMATDTYALIMSSFAYADAHLANSLDDVSVMVGDKTVVLANEGDYIRSQFVDVQFKNVRKYIRNSSDTGGHAVFVGRGTKVEVDVFRNMPFVDEAFRKNFPLTVDSNFDYTVSDGRISFTVPEEPMSGYLSIAIQTSKLYDLMAKSVERESLSYDFIVVVL